MATSKTSEVKIGERQSGIGFQSLHISAFASQTTYYRKEPMVNQLSGFINGLDLLPQVKARGLELLRDIVDVYDGAGQVCETFRAFADVVFRKLCLPSLPQQLEVKLLLLFLQWDLLKLMVIECGDAQLSVPMAPSKYETPSIPINLCLL